MCIEIFSSYSEMYKAGKSYKTYIWGEELRKYCKKSYTWFFPHFVTLQPQSLLFWFYVIILLLYVCTKCHRHFSMLWTFLHMAIQSLTLIQCNASKVRCFSQILLYHFPRRWRCCIACGIRTMSRSLIFFFFFTLFLNVWFCCILWRFCFFFADTGGFQFGRMAHAAGSHCKTGEDCCTGRHRICCWSLCHIVQLSSIRGGTTLHYAVYQHCFRSCLFLFSFNIPVGSLHFWTCRLARS